MQPEFPMGDIPKRDNGMLKIKQHMHNIKKNHHHHHHHQQQQQQNRIYAKEEVN